VRPVLRHSGAYACQQPASNSNQQGEAYRLRLKVPPHAPTSDLDVGGVGMVEIQYKGKRVTGSGQYQSPGDESSW